MGLCSGKPKFASDRGTRSSQRRAVNIVTVKVVEPCRTFARETCHDLQSLPFAVELCQGITACFFHT